MPRYRLIGSNGSPYSMKLRAILRYRRLPHDYVLRTTRNRADTADVKPQLLPMLRFPGEERYRVDSTPLAYALEERHAERSILPTDPAHAFLSHLIEDMADEWLTKAMFHYRWAYAADIDYASHWIADDSNPDARGAARDAVAKAFADRQIGRMALVGCTPANAPVIEETYLRVLDILETHVGLHDYLFGGRPALADFGLFGQLKTLATDPTPMAVMRRRAPRTENWVRQLDDASGVEGEWSDSLSPAATALLRFCGEVYLPFLLANARAVDRGEGRVSLTLLGRTYSQDAFPYQAKCLIELRRGLGDLGGAARDRALSILASTGCQESLASA